MMTQLKSETKTNEPNWDAKSIAIAATVIAIAAAVIYMIFLWADKLVIINTEL